MKKIMILALFIASQAWAQLVIPPITAECATSVDGSVVLVPNPLTGPAVSPVFSGTLPAATYFVEIAWYDAAAHVTLASPEIQSQLLSTGELQISPPVSGMPATAVGMRVFIGTASGTETLQGSTTGSATFTQSVPLVSGSAPPSSNTTVCQIIANDAGWPSGTGYNFSLTTPAGQTLPGYPLQTQFLGPGNTVDLSAGLPLYNGMVTYPVPILSRPYGHGPQSISGPLSMTSYNLTSVGKIGLGTAVPAWAVDAEGSSLLGAINANTGYLFNGAAPANHVLLGNGSYYVDSATVPASIVSGLFYQTVDANAVAQTQRPVLNFSSYFTLSDSASPARTNVTPVTTGSEAKLVTAAGSGTTGNCAKWLVTGGVGDSGGPCASGITQYKAAGGCLASTGCTVSVTWDAPFADASYFVNCTPTGLNSSGAAFWISGKSGSGFTINITALGFSNPGGFTGFDCEGHHN